MDGLWKPTENDYDVIVLGVMLPSLDGYQVCRRLRERGRWTPILMLTAMDDDLDYAEGLDSGADDYLAKPFSYPLTCSKRDDYRAATEALTRAINALTVENDTLAGLDEHPGHRL